MNFLMRIYNIYYANVLWYLYKISKSMNLIYNFNLG